MTFALLVAAAALVAAGSGMLLWRLAPAGAHARRRHGGAMGFDQELLAGRPRVQAVDDDVAWDEVDGPLDPAQRAVRIAGLVVLTVVGAAAVAVILYAIGHFAFQALLHYVPHENE